MKKQNGRGKERDKRREGEMGTSDEAEDNVITVAKLALYNGLLPDQVWHALLTVLILRKAPETREYTHALCSANTSASLLASDTIADGSSCERGERWQHSIVPDPASEGDVSSLPHAERDP